MRFSGLERLYPVVSSIGLDPVFLKKRGCTDGNRAYAITAGETFAWSVTEIRILPQSQLSGFGGPYYRFSKRVVGMLLSHSGILLDRFFRYTGSAVNPGHLGHAERQSPGLIQNDGIDLGELFEIEAALDDDAASGGASDSG